MHRAVCFDEFLDIGSDGDTPPAYPPNSYSCDECGRMFTTLSKMNKHLNGHTKPVRCLFEGCGSRFSQYQALGRHIQIRHEREANITKYYHCTTDGCKYASSGDIRRSCTRVDQIKLHIKEYGHYGPHSARERQRLPGSTGSPRLPNEESNIPAVFEEWIVEGNSEPQKTLVHYEFDPGKTSLWHRDEIGDEFQLGILQNTTEPLHCPVPGCYYHISPPDNAIEIGFRTPDGLSGHLQRTHQPSKQPRTNNEDTGISLDFMEISDAGHQGFAAASAPLNIKPSSHDGGRSAALSAFMGEQADLYQNIPMKSLDSGFFDGRQEGSSKQLAQVDASDLKSEIQEADRDDTSQYSEMANSGYWSIPDTATDFSNTSNTFSTATTPSAHSRSSSMSSIGKRPCKWPNCNLGFRRKADLQRHYRSVHVQLLVGTCSFCGEAYTRKDKYKEHLIKHEKEQGIVSPSNILKLPPPSAGDIGSRNLGDSNLGPNFLNKPGFR